MSDHDRKPEPQPADPQTPTSMTRTSETPPSIDEGDPATTDDGSATRETD